VNITAVPPFFWPPGDGDEPGDRPLGSIGHDGMAHMVVRSDGAVVAVARDRAGEIPDRYVNSSADRFVMSLQLFAGEWQRRSGPP
jgi:hypothetical protein